MQDFLTSTMALVALLGAMQPFVHSTVSFAYMPLLIPPALRQDRPDRLRGPERLRWTKSAVLSPQGGGVLPCYRVAWNFQCALAGCVFEA